MARRFDAFVMFAEMRTGSNYLEDNLNALPDVTCYGEVFNPTFLRRHNTFELFGYDMARREHDPLGLIDAIIANTDGIAGFRLFHDHDDRVVERVLPDPRIAKVILMRNPLDSYVSRKIATATGQWRLTDMKNAKSAQIRFDADEFAAPLGALMPFQDKLRRGLQVTGQTPFLIRYEDINDPEVLNGLAAIIGSDARLEETSKNLKKQNPSDLRAKVENYDDMVQDLASLDRFGLDTAPDFEPPRRAGVPNFVLHPEAGLLFMPIKGAPDDHILDWMGEIGGVGRDGLLRNFSQKDLRQWMKAHPGFRGFTVLRHPIERAHSVFCRYILPDDRPAYADPRKILRQRYNLPIPGHTPDATWGIDAHRDAFAKFLEFLKGNLAGQTSIRVDAAWASQSAIVQAVSAVAPPHHIVHEADMVEMLPHIARAAGVAKPPPIVVEEASTPVPLA